MDRRINLDLKVAAEMGVKDITDDRNNTDIALAIPVISVSGGGMLMTWYFGALKAIMEVRGGAPVVFASFSSGALACAVFLCKLKHETAAKRYTEMMDERRVSQRLFGLAFIWGDITRQWLEEILPEDAHELCEGSLVVHVLEWRGMLSGFKMRRVKHFPDRATLIQTLLASCHIPCLLYTSDAADD